MSKDVLRKLHADKFISFVGVSIHAQHKMSHTPTNIDIVPRPASPPDEEHPPHPNSVWIPGLGWSTEPTEPIDPPMPRRQSLKKFRSGGSLRSVYRKSDIDDIKEVVAQLKAMYYTDHKKLVAQRNMMEALSKQAMYVNSNIY
jgi:hypothetical protein